MAISPRILYVDDDPDGREMMVSWLTRGYGFHLTTEPDGLRAGKRIDQEFFDLYLLDYCLPDTTATSLCRRVRLINPDAPIIVYSALDRDIDRRQALEAGATLYFVKPAQIEQVISEIVRIIRRAPGPAKPARPALGRSSSIVPNLQHIQSRRKASGIV